MYTRQQPIQGLAELCKSLKMPGMATVNSSSTRQQVLDAIADNASYQEDQSIAKCRAYCTALRVFLNRWGFEESQKGASRLRYNVAAQYRADLTEAQAWLNTQSSQAGQYGSTRALSIENFRE